MWAENRLLEIKQAFEETYQTYPWRTDRS